MDVRCSICKFPAHVIFDWRLLNDTLRVYGWTLDPVVCPVCKELGS